MAVLTKDEKLAIIDRYDANKEQVLNILLDLQFASDQGYIDQETAQFVADHLHMTQTRVFEIISFYAILKDQPQARYVLKVCDSSPCHFAGGEIVKETLEEILNVKENEATEDGLFMYHKIPCFGACAQAPLIKIKDQIFSNLTKEKIQTLIQDLKDQKYPEL